MALTLTDVRRIAELARLVGDAHLRLRDDVVTEGDARAANQQSAPVVAEGLFLVPRVIE